MRAKLVALAIVLAVVPLTVMGFALIDVNASTVATNSKELEIAVLDDLASVIEDELEKAETGLDAVARWGLRRLRLRRRAHPSPCCPRCCCCCWSEACMGPLRSSSTS